MDSFFNMPPLDGASALPAPPLAQMGSGAAGVRHGRGRGRGDGRPVKPHAPTLFPRVPRLEDRGVKRARECPCAARLFLLESNDIATGNDVCSAVLGVPTAAAAGAVAVADPQPVSVYMLWADTTLLEVAMEALRAARGWADRAFTAAAEATAAAAVSKEEGANREESSASGDGEEARATVPVPTTSAALTAPHDARQRLGRKEEADSRDDREEPLPHYSIELLCGYVDNDGKTVVHGLGTVELRQVMVGRPELVYPVRPGRGCVHYNAVATELGFGYGNPILFTCTRTK